MPRVFITGASGFIGRALSDRYRADGWEVGGVDLAADPARGIVAGDVAERGPWQDVEADLVVHTAAFVGMRATGLDAVWRANVVGTRNAVEAAERAGARLVHFSSVTVFGTDFEDGVDETAPVRVTGLPYADTKIASEQLVLQAHIDGRVAGTIVRPGDVYGPGSRAWAVIPYELLRRRRFLLPAGGRGIFSPVYIDDLVDGVVRAADGPAGQVFILSGGVGVPNRDFFGAYAALSGTRLPTAPAPLALAFARVRQALPGDDDVNPYAVRYMLRRGTYSIAKAQRVLGYQPAVTLEDGLERTVTWLRSR